MNTTEIDHDNELVEMHIKIPRWLRKDVRVTAALYESTPSDVMVHGALLATDHRRTKDQQHALIEDWRHCRPLLDPRKKS